MQHPLANFNLSSLLRSIIALLLLASPKATQALEVEKDYTLCGSAYTWVQPTPAERLASSGFEWTLSYFNETASPNLLSRYFSWPPVTGYSKPVYTYENRTYDSQTRTWAAQGDASYVVDFSLKELWNASWLDTPTPIAQAKAFVIVTLVANVSRTISASAATGNVSIVNRLLGSDGRSVQAMSVPRSLHCEQVLNSDGTLKSNDSPTRSRGGAWSIKKTGTVIAILVITAIALSVLLCVGCAIRKRRRANRTPEEQAAADAEESFLRRQYRAWQRRRAADRMTEPAAIDDTEKLGVGVHHTTAQTSMYATASPDTVGSRPTESGLPPLPNIGFAAVPGVTHVGASDASSPPAYFPPIAFPTPLASRR